MIAESTKSECLRYKSLAESALEQVNDDDLHRALGADGNSIAVIVNHLAGNLKSRFTNFRTEDGEKSWRDRDAEFEENREDRNALQQKWNDAWRIVFEQLDALSDEDLSAVVRIRGQELTIATALHRSLAHTAYHVGQIVLIARICAGNEWKSISIPRGKSQEYNANPAREAGVTKKNAAR